MRVVLVTNVLVSALVFPGGPASDALARVVDGRDVLVTSKPLIHELVRVLGEKFARDPELLSRTAVFVADLGELVAPRRRLSVLTDEPDNRVLECTAAGRARRIVTDDRAMLRLRAYAGIEIVGLRTHLAST